ncbi:MAG: YIP1 family protein [Acidobacteriota bacterium]|nr:YIP1 family protein [Acidobacteriota bacterium]MDH3529120.1 YIP1 family protein [Acidobacteriota bacterium]
MYTGIALMAVGAMIAVLGFTNVVPNIGGPGVSLVFLGALVLGLSFVKRPDPESVEEMPLFSRLLNIFLSPGEVFENIRYHPSFLGVLLIASIISGIYAYAFFERLTPERITNYTVDKIAESGFVPDEQVATVRAQTLETNKNPVSRVGSAVSGFAGMSFLAAFMGLLFFVTALAMGGKINYLQALSVAAFSLFPVILIQKVMSLLILFLKDPIEIHPIIGQGSLFPDNLGILISSADNPVLYSFLTYVGLLGFYWLWLNATGLQKAGRRVSGAAGWTGAVIVWLLGLAISVVSAVFFGNFLS